LGEALQRLGSDTGVGAIVVTVAGRGFCAGGDVKTMESRAAQAFEDASRGCAEYVPAVGAGLGLALACDLRIAGHSAHFGTGFAGVGYSGAKAANTHYTRSVAFVRFS
jgi:2-(1,2-epoxy-1,2-dihydrophenyl)acetyl-CoA isomerase